MGYHIRVRAKRYVLRLDHTSVSGSEAGVTCISVRSTHCLDKMRSFRYTQDEKQELGNYVEKQELGIYDEKQLCIRMRRGVMY